MANSDIRAFFAPEILDYQKKSDSKGTMESDVNNKSNYDIIFLDESDSTKFNFLVAVIMKIMFQRMFFHI